MNVNNVVEQMGRPHVLKKIIEKEKKLSEKIGDKFGNEMVELRAKLERQVTKGEIAPNKEGLGKDVVDMVEWAEKNMPNELHKLSLSEVEELLEKRKSPYEPKVVLALAQIFALRRTIH